MKFLNIFFLLLLFKCSIIIAQSPRNDSNWELDFSDEFTDPALFDSLYTPRVYTNSLIHGDAQELQCYRKANIEYREGILNLIAKKEPVFEKLNVWVDDSTLLSDGKPNKRWFDYSSGAIMTNFRKPYGYFEASCKIPKGRGFWPAFWLHYNPGCDRGNEIDILEPNGHDSQTTDQYSVSVHYSYSSGDECLGGWNGFLLMNLPDLSKEFHRYAVEWTPEKLFFYFDDTLVRYINRSYVPDTNMYIIANLALDPWNRPKQRKFRSKSLQLDYIKYFRLKMDCEDRVSAEDGDNFNFSGFEYKVKKSFSISNTSIPIDEKVTLRATDFIEFTRDFEVPVGSEFNAITIPYH